MYIARARSAKASQQLNEMLDRVGTNNAMAAFERMEERVLQLEAQSEAIAELSTGDSIEKQFKALESGGNVDDELAALKAKLTAGDAPSLPPVTPAKRAAIDDELEQLRAKLEEN
jgi:phage shock protein A